jgi:hypothetical protein
MIRLERASAVSFPSQSVDIILLVKKEIDVDKILPRRAYWDATCEASGARP